MHNKIKEVDQDILKIQSILKRGHTTLAHKRDNAKRNSMNSPKNTEK